MTTATKRTAEFKPDFVYIPFVHLPEPRDRDSVVDPADCTLLHLDADSGNEGWLYSKTQWDSGAEATIYRNGPRGECTGLGEGDIVELLPDLWIVKTEERQYWQDPVIQELTKAIYSVYAINRRQHVHICSITPCYEACYIGTQYDESRELSDDEREALEELIREGSAANPDYSYFDVSDIDRICENPCRPYFTPANGKSGGFAYDCGMVRTADCYTWIREHNATNGEL